MSNKLFRRRILIVCICLVVAVCATVFMWQKSTDKVTAYVEPLYVLSVEQRVEMARADYGMFKRNPDDVKEVIISFNEITSDEMLTMIPSTTDVISLYHYFEYGDKIASGCHINWDLKPLEVTLAEYMETIYSMAESGLETNKRRLAKYEEQIDLLKAIDENTKEYESKCIQIRQNIDRDEAHLTAIDNGVFMMSGIRIKATHSVLDKLASDSRVFTIELVDGGLETLQVGMLDPIVVAAENEKMG